MHYAEINPQTNEVLRVIVCESKAWCESRLGGTWVRTFYSTEGKKYAGQGDTYHPDKENFSAPRPFPSWTLDDSLQWVPPVPRPDDGQLYTWNEEEGQWTLVTQ